MTESQKKAKEELELIVKLTNEITGKKYKAADVQAGSYQLVKEIVLEADLRVSEKTVADFLLTDGKVDETKPNADGGKKFYQGTLPAGISCKFKADLVTDGVIPAGTYNLFAFGGATRPSFAVSDLTAYNKVDAWIN